MNKIYWVILSVLLVSCGQQKIKRADSDFTSIPIFNPVQISVDSLIVIHDIIKLETNDASLFNGIHELHVGNNKLYITDSNRKGVYIFDERGGFLNKISNLGQGPQEYIEISSFETDFFHNQLLLADYFSKRLLIYDDFGKLKQVIQLGFCPKKIVSDKKGKFYNLYSGTHGMYEDIQMDQHNVHLINGKGVVEKFLLPDQTPNRIDLTSILTVSYDVDSVLLYQPILSDTIYRVTQNAVSPAYVLDNHSDYKLLTKDDRKKIGFIFGYDNSFEVKEKEGYLLSWNGFLNSETHLFFCFGWNRPFYVYYSKVTQKAFSLQPEKSIGNKALREIFLNFPPYTLHHNLFYARVNGIEAMRLAPLLPEGQLKTALQQMTPEDNPIIIRYSINFPET